MQTLTPTSINFSILCISSLMHDIGMNFGLNKCAKCTLKKGKKAASENFQLEDGSNIADLSEDSSYNYLDIEENASIEHKTMRERITKQNFKRLKAICKTELTPKNKIQAINQLAIPVISYGFGVVDWPQGLINDIDVRTGKLLTIHKITYKNSV